MTCFMFVSKKKKTGCHIYGYGIVDKNICDCVVNYWIENCDDKWMLMIFGCIYEYGIC
jgi:hypothetical protein